MAVWIKLENMIEGMVIFATEPKLEGSPRTGHKKMNIIDLRNKFRETPSTRRLKDRRDNPFPYGSEEWRNFIVDNGFAFPPADRRAESRCTDDMVSEEGQGNEPEKPYVRILLTPAERKLLEDVFLSELE